MVTYYISLELKDRRETALKCFNTDREGMRKHPKCKTRKKNCRQFTNSEVSSARQKKKKIHAPQQRKKQQASPPPFCMQVVFQKKCKNRLYILNSAWATQTMTHSCCVAMCFRIIRCQVHNHLTSC